MLATAINAAILAVVDAGVPLLSLGIATTVHFQSTGPVSSLKKEEESMVLDLDALQAKEPGSFSSVVLVFSVSGSMTDGEETTANSGQALDTPSPTKGFKFSIVTMKATGCLHPSQLQQAFKTGKENAATVLAFMTTALQRRALSFV